MPSSTNRPLIIGNWKMNGLHASLREIEKMAAALSEDPAAADVVLCPPSTLIISAAALAYGAPLSLGAQDCHTARSGAFTGDLSAEMLADAGASLVILGHSERRRLHGESDELIAAKAQAALRAGLLPVICVGETLAQREAGAALATIQAQLSSTDFPPHSSRQFAIAYEPCWAIGAGLTPSPEEIGEMHAFIRTILAARFGERQRSARILYGGSVKADNASQILQTPGVDGVLVGGASLSGDEFLRIARAA